VLSLIAVFAGAWDSGRSSSPVFYCPTLGIYDGLSRLKSLNICLNYNQTQLHRTQNLYAIVAADGSISQENHNKSRKINLNQQNHNKSRKVNLNQQNHNKSRKVNLNQQNHNKSRKVNLNQQNHNKSRKVNLNQQNHNKSRKVNLNQQNHNKSRKVNLKYGLSTVKPKIN
jgi:hypothetical protein